METHISCTGSDGENVAFISKSNQSDSYHLYYLNMNRTLIYSNNVANIKGYPTFANFTGFCSYHDIQSSILMLFESLNSTSHSSSSVISQLKIGAYPSFTNETVLKDTKIVSAVNIASQSIDAIAFISEKLQGLVELSLNLLYPNGTISKWTPLNQTGTLLSSVQTNHVYILQNNSLSECHTNSSISYLFSIPNSALPANIMYSKQEQLEYIYFYDQTIQSLVIYTHTVPPLFTTTIDSRIQTSLIHSTRTIKNKQSATSAFSSPSRTKRDGLEWKRDLRPVSATGCFDGSCVMTVVALTDDKKDGRPSWFALTSHGQGDFSIAQVFEDALPSPTYAVSIRSDYLSEGGIAGIIIGAFMFLALVLGLYWFIRRRSKIVSYKSRHYTFKESIPSQSVAISHSLLQTTPYGVRPGGIFWPSPQARVTEERPDIRPLSYVEGRIDYAHLSDEEMIALEPEESEFMSLFNGAYTSPAEQTVYRTETHTTRTFFTERGECSVHYFTAPHLETFIRAVHAVSLQDSEYVMKSERAIVLASPTPKFNYQSIWITSPTPPSNTLHTFLLHHKPTEVQKAQWVWGFLKAVQSVHQHGLVHLSLDTHSFYQTASGGWILGDFITVQKEGSLVSRTQLGHQSRFIPPEYLKEEPQLATAEADLWSLGGVIYTVVTQDLVTLTDEMVLDNVRDPSFRMLLDTMLQISPNCRKSIQFALDSWNSIYHFEST